MIQQALQLKQLFAIFIGLLIAIVPTINAEEKWSRQIEETAPGQVDAFSDWVPLAQPLDGSSKDREARVLTYSQSFPPNGRFGEISKAQQTFDFPFQRFGGAPQHQQQLRQHSAPIASALKSQEPTSQSFFKFEMPYRGDSVGRPIGGPPTLQTGYQIQHTFGGGAQATLFNAPFYHQQPLFPPEFNPLSQKPVQQHLQKQKPLHQQNFIEDTFSLKSTYRESKPPVTQHPLQSVTPQVFPAVPQPETAVDLNKANTFQSQTPLAPPAQAPSAASTAPADPSQQQEVQLLYVPYDTLYNQQQQQQQQQQEQQQGPSEPTFDINKFNLNAGLPAVNPYQINQFYTQDPLVPQDANFFGSSTTSRPMTTSLKPSNIFQDFLIPQTTTPKPKPKAHQPPLAMFLLRSNSRPTQHDVVASLRNANMIAVIDAPIKNTPYIFVGPAGMPIPDGYVKFDLPYLSQLTHTRDLSDVPFFVAPLSYRTLNGFHKILLPEPHVGSIVINRAKDIAPNSNAFNTDNNQYQTTRQHPRPTQHRLKPTSAPKDFYSNNPYGITTQRATLQPTRGNKFNYFYDQDQGIHEIHSPKVNKHERAKKKRPQTVQIEQPSDNFFSQYLPNQLNNDQFYKLRTNKPTTSTTSTSTTSTPTTSTTTSTTPPPNFFTYNTSPQIEFQSTKGQLYHDFNSAAKDPEASQEYAPRFTTRPPPTTLAEDEYRMKQYYRQQDAFRNRPQFIHTTNSPFEQVQYTPVQLDYDRGVNAPSTTDRTTTTTKHRVTYYTPSVTPATPTEGTLNTLPALENVGEYGSSNSELQSEKVIPSNHRPSYNQNEILDGTVEYEPNPYQLPSELPPLTPNLPGLVNDLQDQSKLNANEQNTPPAATTASEPEPPTRPTRRPINRVRKPVVTKVTSSVSYSESETSTKRPARPERIRRPYGTRNGAVTSATADKSENNSTTTRRPPSARNPLIRNPNRVRYQPTPEERQSLRTKHRKQSGSKKGNDQEDLDYQRDVLKQNYPVFKGRKPTSPTAIPSSYAMTTTEGATSETQQVYTVTPSNNIDQAEQTFPVDLLEPMQIAQHYNEYSKENYGPGYFPNQEDLNPTEPIYKNEINPVFTTIPSTTSTMTTQRTTTTEEPATTTRRSPFIRRNFPRLRTTTTETPTITTTPASERPSIRSRAPPRKVIKVRARTRRPPHPASSTTVSEEEAPQEEVKSNNYRKLSRFNSDLYENDSTRRRYKSKFQLEGQESQWSPALKSQNHFQPLIMKEATEEPLQKSELEPEIVTADPTVQTEEKKPETYEFNVSANFGSSTSEQKTTIKSPNLKPEKSFAELLEEVMGKAPEEQPLTTDSDMRTTDGTYFESQKTTASDRLNRRGKWKEVKTPVSNSESFETAESQNIGAHLFSSLNEQQKNIHSTTPLTSNTADPMTAATSLPQNMIEDFQQQQQLATTTTIPVITKQSDLMMTTTPKTLGNIEESTSVRQDDLKTAAVNDDLETQPSLFSEVKKQLHDLFAIESEDDRAVTAALAAVGRRRQEYMNIKRDKPTATTEATSYEATTATIATTASELSISTTPTSPTDDSKKGFHKNLMEHVVYATSTSAKVTSETEICYRGRCIRSEDLPSNHKLN